MAANEERAVKYRAFSAYGRPLEMVTSFRYLGWVISAADDDWPAVVRNLSRARAMWKRMTRILSREGAELQVSVFFFKAVVQAVFLFRSETCVVTPRMVRVLGGFQDQVAQRLTGRLAKRKTVVKWEYNLLTMEMEEVGFHMMEQYISEKRTPSRSTLLRYHY